MQGQNCDTQCSFSVENLSEIKEELPEYEHSQQHTDDVQLKCYVKLKSQRLHLESIHPRDIESDSIRSS